MPYKIINHTGDFGIELESPYLDKLFAEAGIAMFEETIENFHEVKPQKNITISIKSLSLEELLHDYLSELLFYFDTEGFIPKEIDVRVDPQTYILNGKISGENFDPKKHIAKVGIKGVTYHLFALRRENDLWKARIIFDI